MSEPSSAEGVLSQAREREKEYDWLGVVESYKKALAFVPEKDYLRRGEIEERLGYAFYRGAMQAENQQEFKEEMQQAVEAYEKARGFYEKLMDEPKAAWVFRSEGFAKYFGSLLTSNPPEKRKLLDECLELVGKALAGFVESGNTLEYWKTYSELWVVFVSRGVLEWDRQVLRRIVEEGMQWGEKAVAALSQPDSSYEIAKAILTLTACLGIYGMFIAEPEEQEKNRLRNVEYLSKALGLAEKIGDSYLLGSLHFWLASCTGGEESERHLEKALEYGKRTRDNFLIAGVLDGLVDATYWKAVALEDPEKKKELVERAMRFYDESQRRFNIISFKSFRGGGIIASPAGYAEHYFLAAWEETDHEKKLEFLVKSEKAGMEALKLAEDSDMPETILYVLHVISKTLESRARIESNLEEKSNLLQRALGYREKAIEIGEQLTPFDYWNHGVHQSYLAGIKAELADIESDHDRKRRLFEEAVSSKEKCLESCDKVMPYMEGTGNIQPFAALRIYQDTYATLLLHLYNLTSKTEYLRKTIEISQKAIESSSKLDMVSRIAESFWKIAKAQDNLGKYLEAAQNFEQASESYMKAAEKIPQLKDLYQDYASYMKAWGEIEKAKHHHERQEHGSAKEHFEKAANLHGSLKQWSYMAPNYAAWAQVENGEDLSRKEQSEEALQAFAQAARLFKQTQNVLQTELPKIENADERGMATIMVKATDLRHEYCTGRIALEEAKILDKKGDHYSSSEKYGLAAETFAKISQALESEQERKEFRFIISLSRAWQKMTQAEAEVSPALYLEASQLFEEAKDYSPNEKAKMLALGNSRFCKALEAGTKFADTRDTTMHTIAIKSLESAANYYVKAGFQRASEYAKATELLFDAYVHMDNAKEEKDPEKKAKLYMIAEKVLQTSAGSYMKAEHPEKREQVLRLLEKVKEERELAVSITEVLHAPSIASTTTSFTTPTPTREEAVGLEKFEHADIKANIILHQKELKVGENLDMEIELVNAGKGPALLTKITEVIPEGFELTQKPEMYHVEDSFLNMKGKRLDPLKTEEVRLILKPKVQGVFPLRPRILYLDEDGKYKSYEPEPVEIKISESLTDRIPTGYSDLDNLLLGGIPKNYAVILTSPSCNQRDQLIKRFLETGAKKSQPTFYLITKASGLRSIAQELPSDFYLFICNPQADEMIRSQPNVFKLRGVENLTDINIALSSAFRELDKLPKGMRRVCIEIVSDVLLQHDAVQTRRWLNALITEFKSKDFTTLAVMDPGMHTPQAVRAILDLFEGEINIYDKESEMYLRIKRMHNQRYLNSELPLSREKLFS